MTQTDPNTQPDPLAMHVATFLGILQGDSYGGGPDTKLPEGIPTPNSTQPQTVPMADPEQGQDVLRNMIANHEDPKAITPPDHGGTIYSGSFAHDLLGALNLPNTYENVRAINAWMKAETGNQDPSTPRYNPLATTQKYGQYTIFNKDQVKNYADYNTGVLATANVLVNGKYNNILAALAKGNDAMAVAHAVASSPWGTGNGVVKVLGG